MEYVQEQITTLHALRDPTPEAPVDRASVVVPMTEREYGGLAAEGVLSELAALDPGRVVVPLRAPPETVGDFCEWLDSFDLSVDVVWCSGPRLTDLLADHGLNGEGGKGRDMWLALGQVLESEYVVCHDADTKTYDRSYVPRLLFPLENGHTFSKGYYARVENNQLYGRLFRLFYAPLVRTLADSHDDPLLEYLSAFRYALAGEFAATGELVSKLRVQRSWGLEVGTVGDAYAHAGFEGTAQVDLGAYEHDHRAVSGPAGLSEMSSAVGDALFQVLDDHGIKPDYDSLAARYQTVADRYVDQYAVDAAYNGLSYDATDERDQIDAYSQTVGPPGVDSRLPAWREAPISPEAVAEAAAADLAAATDSTPPVSHAEHTE